MKTEGLARQQVLREMMDLAMGRANDAVKLAYLEAMDRPAAPEGMCSQR